MKNSANIFVLCIIFITLIFLLGCTKEESIALPRVTDFDSGEEVIQRKNLKLGVVPGPYGDMFLDAILPILSQKGYSAELVHYNDFIRPNFALSERETDLNMFQHTHYLNNFKYEHDLDITAIAEIPTISMGIYSRRFRSINNLGTNITVSIPNDATNLSRALRVLNAANVITLNPSVDMTRVTENDIISNPHRIRFVLINAQDLVNTLGAYDVSVINGNFAIAGGLNPADALYNEVLAEGFVNIIAVRSEDLGQQFVRDIIDITYSEEYIRILTDPNRVYSGFQRPRYFFGR
jgi:D-methionine transport system substrate-binding protein